MDHAFSCIQNPGPAKVFDLSYIRIKSWEHRLDALSGYLVFNCKSVYMEIYWVLSLNTMALF